MKNTRITFLSFIFTLQLFSQVFTGDLLLNSQSDINTFNYIEVDGDLIIEESTPNEILNLNNLISLTSVSGDLIIKNNASVTNLIGLDNLVMIGRELEITNNNNLATLSGINSLTSILRLTVKDNLMLNSIQGLSNVTGNLGNSSSVGISIENNENLVNIDDLNVTQTRDLIIRNNPLLTSMSSFSTIGLAGDIFIEDNPLLSSIPDFLIPSSGLNNVSIKNNDIIINLPTINKKITRSLVIDNNDSITNLNGLEDASLGFIFPSGEIYISNNDNLITLDGLSSDLSAVVSIEIVNNDLLTNVNWFSNITSVRLVVDGNDSLLSLAPLTNFTIGSLLVYGNTLLTDLDGVQNITSLTILEIVDTNLSSVNSFDSLISIGDPQVSEPFNIANNNNLISLDGFENVTTFVNGNFRVNENDNLEDFCAFSDLVNNGGLSNGYFVSNNLYNPTMSDFSTGDCATLSLEEFDNFDATIYPNPTSDYLTIMAEAIVGFCDIYSITGEKISSYKNARTIDVEHLSRGLYFLRITDNQGRKQIMKFIKK